MNRLKEIRLKKGISQVDFYNDVISNELNIKMTLRAYQNWESGASEIKRDYAQLIAEYFDIPMAYLLGYDEEYQAKIFEELREIKQLLLELHNK